LNFSKIVSTKTTSAIFLAIVLLTGTIAAISPTFIIKGVNAQGDSYYGLDSHNDRKSYGMDDSYGYPDYRDDKKKYHSYGPTEFGMDKDKKPYGMDSYEPEYQQSYKPDYKPTYPSYGEKDNRDKSKDDKNVIDIKKIKCNNINVNLNAAGGTGNGDNGNTPNENGNKTDGFKKIDRDGFTFICINNNNNVVSGGNVTEQEPDQVTCEECFSILSDADREGFLGIVDAILTSLNVPHEELLTIGDLCEFLETSTYQDKRALLNSALNSESVPAADINSILSCLEELGIL
jgi:hypothetical protein